MKSVVQSAIAMAAKTPKQRQEDVLPGLASYIRDSLEHRQEMTAAKLIGRTCAGAYVSGLYLLVKALYLTNVIGQFFLLNRFLGTRYRFWGIQILADLVRGIEWQESGHFPRVTMCDFEVV